MSDDLATWLRAQLDEIERRESSRMSYGSPGERPCPICGDRCESVTTSGREYGITRTINPCGHEMFDADYAAWVGTESAARPEVLARVQAHRTLLDLHHPVRFTSTDLGIVDALVCFSCHSRMDEPDDWPQERDWPYPVVQDPYPCRTLRALASAHAHLPGYREEWKP